MLLVGFPHIFTRFLSQLICKILICQLLEYTVGHTFKSEITDNRHILVVIQISI